MILNVTLKKVVGSTGTKLMIAKRKQLTKVIYDFVDVLDHPLAIQPIACALVQLFVIICSASCYNDGAV